ncbi:MAG TPA: SEC-C domain-containing protein [Baekduia sp.]|nr:SEC-C domain-containing protein [Baekduia sp.]
MSERQDQIDAIEARIDRLEGSGRYDEAIEVLGELEEVTGEDQRWHVAWMHVLAGRRGDADAIWAALERERPGDPAVSFLAGSAHAEAQEPEVAAELFERSLEIALHTGADAETLRQILDARAEALTDAELAPGPVDEVARRALARAAAQGADTPVATPYFPPEEFARALDAWPAFADDWSEDGHAAYAHELDERMRAVSGGAPRRPVVVPLTVDEVEAHAAAHDIDPDWAEARARTAWELAREDPARVLAWPPGRNDPCWCGSGRKHKRCCGR